jgi:two-component system sensor histidine kinase QseC
VKLSLRTRLVIGVVAATVLVLAASSIAIYALMRASLFAQFDAALGRTASALAALVEQDGTEIEAEFQEADPPEFRRGDRPEYLQCWRENGEVLYRSPSLGRARLDRKVGPLDRPVCRSLTLPDGRRGRVVHLTFLPRREGWFLGKRERITLSFARDTEDVDGTLTHLRLLLVAVCGVAAVVSAALLTWVVRAGLRPVARLASDIGGVGVDDLAAKLDAGDAPKELLPVVARLNDLLARLESAFERERAFSANVAHELRTPLAGLRSTLEVALSGPRGLESFEEALRDSFGISCQMHAMVENLLAMAQCDAGQLGTAREPVQVDRLLDECWSTLAESAEERELHVEWQVARPCTITTDREKLRLILQNVLSNAVTYADKGGAVRVAAHADDGGASLTVRNSGSKLSGEEAGHVLERFWRGDSARSDAAVHCGLGLALCERLMALLGGSISVTSRADGEFVVELRFEARAEPGGAAGG